MGLPEADHRDPAAAHDRLDVVEVQVYQARLRDQLRESLDRAHEHLVRELERRLEGQPRHELEEPVVRNRDDGVRGVAQPVEAPLRSFQAEPALPAEGHRDDRDREGADVAAATRSGAASEPTRDEDHVGAREDGAQLLLRLARCLLADLRKRTGAQSASHPAAQEDFLRRADRE